MKVSDLVDRIYNGVQLPPDHIEHKTVEEYIAEKYRIRGDADGQEHTG